MKIESHILLIVPIALYGCQVWTLKKAEEKQLLVFEMAALRKILGIHIMDKIRNENIRMALNLTDTIMQKVHERQHKWLRHIVRMDENRNGNTALHGGVEWNTLKRTPNNNMVKINIGKIYVVK